MGENFYVNHNCVILDVAKVEFGDNVFIGSNCGFYTAGHLLDVETRNQGKMNHKTMKREKIKIFSFFIDKLYT